MFEIRIESDTRILVFETKSEKSIESIKECLKNPKRKPFCEFNNEKENSVTIFGSAFLSNSTITFKKKKELSELKKEDFIKE